MNNTRTHRRASSQDSINPSYFYTVNIMQGSTITNVLYF